jgi:polar amino acid transport system substrate-binding protein
MACRAAFVALFSLCLSFPVWAETIVVFGAMDYPGICFLKDGKPQGIFPAILAGVSKFSGDTYELHLYPWRRAQALALAGEGGIAHFSSTNERRAHFDFSDPVYGDDIDLVVLKGREFSYEEPLNLKGRRVGAMAGASFGQQIDQMMESGEIKVDRDYGVVGRLHKLLVGRIDVAVVEGSGGDIDDLVGSDEELRQNKAKFAFLPGKLVHDPLYLAFAKTANRKDVLSRFNAGLAKFKKTPAYRRLAGS